MKILSGERYRGLCRCERENATLKEEKAGIAGENMRLRERLKDAEAEACRLRDEIGQLHMDAEDRERVIAGLKKRSTLDGRPPKGNTKGNGERKGRSPRKGTGKE